MSTYHRFDPEIGHWIFQSGRSSTGRLRNFGAMSNQKLTVVYNDVHWEHNDPEAYEAVEFEMIMRKLPVRKNPFYD